MQLSRLLGVVTVAILLGWPIGKNHSVSAQEPSYLFPSAPQNQTLVSPLIPRDMLVAPEALFPPSPSEQQHAPGNDLQLAERQLRAYLQQNPGNEEAIVKLGLVLLKLNRTQEAIDFLYQQHVQSPNNTKIMVTLGQALLEGRCICDALNMFYTASLYYPNMPDINYWIGLAQLHARTPLAAYHTLLSGNNSTTDYARAQQLARGTALAGLGLQCEASAEYQAVAQQGPDTQLGQRARELQQEMDQALCGAPRYRGFFKVGFRYDDNPGVVPTTNVFGTPLANAPSGGMSYAGQLLYDVYRGYNRNVVAGYTLFGTGNYDANQFNLMDNAVFVAMAQRGLVHDCLPYTAGLRFDYDNLLVGQNPYLDRFGVTPSFTLADSDFTSVTLLYRFTDLYFYNQGAAVGTAFDKNSVDNAVGLFRQWQTIDRNWLFLAGYLFDNNQAAGSNFNYNGNQIQVGMTWLMPFQNMQFNALQQVYFRNYADAGRNDTESVTQLLLLYPIRNQWYATLGWLHDDNTSNQAFAAYRRNVVELGLQYNFPQGNPFNAGLLNQRTTY